MEMPGTDDKEPPMLVESSRYYREAAPYAQPYVRRTQISAILPF
jgi:hypothetical protein